MAFKLDRCVESDFNMEMADVIFDAFDGHSTLMNAVHPDNMAPEGRARSVVFLRAMARNPQAYWVKVTKGAELVGVACYVLFNLNGQKIPSLPMAGPEGNWANEEEKLWAQNLFSSLIENRNHVLSSTPNKAFCLYRICVKPQYQRQGVGSMMMEWGNAMADELGAESTVEATPEGRGLYTKYGYACPAGEAMPLQVSPQFEQRPKQYLYFMHRPIAV